MLLDLYYKLPYFLRYPLFLLKGYKQSKERYGKDFEKFFKQFKQNENLSKLEIDNLQYKKMKKILIYSYENTKYYHNLFDKISFNPYKFKDLSEITKIPVLNKNIIKNNFEDIKVKNNKIKKILHKTGGTTGNPLKFYLTKELKGPINYATMYRFYSWAGVKFKDRRVSIAGRVISKKPPYSMYNIAENQLYVSAHYLNNEKVLSETVNIIKDFKPIFLQGHPSAIDLVAKYMLKKNIYIPLQAIFTTSENLYCDQRRRIEEAFKSEIYDTYGMGEMVAMASECKVHDGYHLAPEYGYTEIINKDKYGDNIGEIVSTSFFNFAMPFIRYHTGDIGKINENHIKCACGVNFPKLEYISGRIDDIIYLQSGKIILPMTLRIELKKLGIDDFQIVQRQAIVFDINIFDVKTNKEKIKKKLKKTLINIFDKRCVLNFNFNQKPILTKNGKKQMIIRKFNNYKDEEV